MTLVSVVIAARNEARRSPEWRRRRRRDLVPYLLVLSMGCRWGAFRATVLRETASGR